jgi:hypothetical protein
VAHFRYHRQGSHSRRAHVGASDHNDVTSHLTKRIQPSDQSYFFGGASSPPWSRVWPNVRAASSACATFSRSEITSDICRSSCASEIERLPDLKVSGGFEDPMQPSRLVQPQRLRPAGLGQNPPAAPGMAAVRRRQCFCRIIVPNGCVERRMLPVLHLDPAIETTGAVRTMAVLENHPCPFPCGFVRVIPPRDPIASVLPGASEHPRGLLRSNGSVLRRHQFAAGDGVEDNH